MHSHHKAAEPGLTDTKRAKRNNLTFSSLRQGLYWKQNYFGMLFGMGKQAISRFETGERRETLVHKEMLSLLAFLIEKKILAEYVQWRFSINISKRFYKKGTPMANRSCSIKK